MAANEVGNGNGNAIVTSYRGEDASAECSGRRKLAISQKNEEMGGCQISPRHS